MGASVDQVHALVLTKVGFFLEEKRPLKLRRRNAIPTDMFGLLQPNCKRRKWSSSVVPGEFI
jgi:hypothetical protein